MTAKPIIFCAIDTDDLDHACALAKKVAPVTGGIKLGLEFFNYFGLKGIEKIMATCPDARLFLDFKFHDIPNTVAGAVRGICHHFAPAYLNVHASGGIEMMRAAKGACNKDTKLLSVTLLTSLDEKTLAQIGFQADIPQRVLQLAHCTKEAGLDGVVCSAHEISLLHQDLGKDFILMVPGIRPEGSAQGDQKRVMTPKQAINFGATHLVIGRPITSAPDPAEAARTILNTLEA